MEMSEAASWGNVPGPMGVEDARPSVSDEHEALLSFIYAAQVGLVQTDLTGCIELISPVTSMLLMPLARQGGLDNLFDVLAPVAPDLMARVAMHPSGHGLICDGRQLLISGPAEPLRVVSLRLVKLDPNRLMATLLDVTAQVQAERARQQAEERLRLAMEAAQVASWQFDVAGQRMALGIAHARRLGLDPMPGEGLPLDVLLQRVHPDERERVRTGLQDACVALQPWRAEFRVQDPHGRWRWLMWVGQPTAVLEQALLMAGVVLETTRVREAEALRRRARELEDENRALAETSRLKSHFVASMSHELRTPLTALIGFAELMRGGMVLPGSPRHAECLEQIASNGRHLMRLIDDVLDLARIEAGRLDWHPVPLALAEIATEVRDALGPTWRTRRQEVVLDIAGDLDALVLDVPRLRQVLYNLLSNAIKFTPEGGRIDLRAWPLSAERFVFEVSDTGIGIAAQDIPKLFVEFQQLSRGHERQVQGSGLGLALTRRLVQAQGGEITVRSPPGQGAVFRVELPRIHDVRPG